MEQITGPLRIILLSALAFTAVLCGLLYFFHPVKGVLVIHPIGEALIRWFAYAAGVFVVLGIICIFCKAVRTPTVVALGCYVMLFLCTCVGIKIFESVDYKRHKKDMPRPRYCMVTKHEIAETNTGKTYYMTLFFEDDEKEQEFSDNTAPLPFYSHVKLNDRARAQCIQGSAGMVYIVSLHRAEKNNP